MTYHNKLLTLCFQWLKMKLLEGFSSLKKIFVTVVFINLIKLEILWFNFLDIMLTLQNEDLCLPLFCLYKMSFST